MKKLFTTRGIAITSFIFVSLFTSVYAVGDINQGISSLSSVVSTLTNTLVKDLATFFATVAMALFFFGIVQYIWGAREGDATKIAKGNTFMKWSLLALFIMFSLWGIILYVQGIFKIQGQNTIIIPSIQTSGGGFQPSSNPLGGECTSYNIGSRCGSGSTLGTCDNSNRCVPNVTSLNERPVYVTPNLVSKGGTCAVTSNCVSGLTCQSNTTAEGIDIKTCE